ncbi:MAG TPA: prenyltransferase/squalene oxidase repeat-containing protein [Nitrososphaerales archaeon]|nr:prenyltransferase/squalene oxidase repeat-containing protein [Nitrososphaerales archaeon]
MSWKEELKYDPVPSLMASKNEPLRYFTAKDLMDTVPEPISKLWALPRCRKIIEVQQPNGSWEYHRGRAHIRSREDYDQIETYRVLRILVEEFGVNKNLPAFNEAAEFLFGHQTEEGDFRGICGNQYVPYYSAAMMELLIKGGYSTDRRIERGFRWLTSSRQNDGGWAFPMRTVGRRLGSETFGMETIRPDKTKPFSHLITGMVLRAFAAHSSYRKSEVARAAAALLASRFFQADKYPDRRTSNFWTSFSYPFWFTDLISSLDSLSLLGLSANRPRIQESLRWFVARQKKDGRWELRLRAMAREEEPSAWISLAISRIFKQFYA